MEEIFIVLIAAAAIGLTVWSKSRIRGFENAYRYDGAFGGKCYEARVRLASGDGEIRCSAGADQSALYLMKDPSRSGSMFRLVGPRSSFLYSLRIPWRDIECRPGRIFFRRCLWFHIPLRKTSFYLAADLGQSLLADAERENVPVRAW